MTAKLKKKLAKMVNHWGRRNDHFLRPHIFPDALSKHVDAEDKGTVAIRDTAYETRVTLINESGLYALILSSKLPQAKDITRVFFTTTEAGPRICCDFCPMILPASSIC